MLTVPVHYDFASSLCYVAHRIMERLAPELEALELTLEWRPLDLTRLSGWRPGVPLDGVRRENVLRVSRELEVPLRVPGRWLDSRPALAVAVALEGTERAAAWRERVWSAVFQEGRAVDEPGELERLARDLGLEVEALADSRRFEALEVHTELAREAHVTGVPSFMLGEWPMAGIQEDATMLSLLSRWAARQRATS